MIHLSTFTNPEGQKITTMIQLPVKHLRWSKNPSEPGRWKSLQTILGLFKSLWTIFWDVARLVWNRFFVCLTLPRRHGRHWVPCSPTRHSQLPGSYICQASELMVGPQLQGDRIKSGWDHVDNNLRMFDMIISMKVWYCTYICIIFSYYV